MPLNEKERNDRVQKSKDQLLDESNKKSGTWLTLLGFVLVAFNLAVRAYCGLYMIISDCDETFNYWEPLNLIARGFGKQTWEYSPAFAIRSYAYLIPYYLITSPLRDFDHLTGGNLPPYAQFYFVRLVALCGFTAFAEVKLFLSARRNFNAHVANWFLLFTTFAPGMSHASVALLPSSFAMTWITWGTASALDVLTLENTFDCVWPSVHAVFCFLVAGLLGWPFALAIGVPFGLFTLASRYQTSPLVRIVLCSVPPFCFLIAFLIGVDSYVYDRTLLFVPFNIVLYNVFSLEGEGPEIFGVEPASYYAKNLLLNFNVVALVGYLGALVNPIVARAKIRSAIGVSVPLLVWSFIFWRQPHKEERFLYPIYTLLSLSAAILVSRGFRFISSVSSSKWLSRVVLAIFLVSYAVVSALRIVNLVENYSAPITSATVFQEISQTLSKTDIRNVCVGREWYHFPTSFFLPDNFRLRFVKSGFDGLLPGDFPEGVSLQEAASAFPRGMNGKNIYSPDKVIDFEQCHYFIDNSLPINPSTGEPNIAKKDGEDLVLDSNWKILSRLPIIRPDGNHSGIGRLLYIPEFVRSFIPYDVEHMDYYVAERLL